MSEHDGESLSTDEPAESGALDESGDDGTTADSTDQPAESGDLDE